MARGWAAVAATAVAAAAATPPQEIKATDIKVGDAIAAMGDIDATAKSVGAMRIVQLDPDQAKRMQEMAANFGKTWLQGKVTAINGTTITLTGSLDNAPHTVVADENTTFRRRRDPITLADIQVGDTVRADGAVNNGVFTATAVSMGGGMGGPPPNGPSSGPPVRCAFRPSARRSAAIDNVDSCRQRHAGRIRDGIRPVAFQARCDVCYWIDCSVQAPFAKMNVAMRFVLSLLAGLSRNGLQTRGQVA